DRPMATIPYPMLSSTGRPDTCGFYESNTNLWKCLRLREELVAMGVDPNNITMSRVKNGPFPYVSGAADAEIYNRPLSEICEEVEVGNYDMFISIHSNAATDGSEANYPLYLYRGYDEGSSGTFYNADSTVTVTYNGNAVEGSRDMAVTNWPYHHFDLNFEPQSYYHTTKNVRGDINFYGSSSGRTDPNTGVTYYGYLGVLKHGAPGFLLEGYFHTYQPARHRALNPDYDYLEGVRVSRGIASYFNIPMKGTGEIVGTVKDMHERISDPLFHYAANSNDQWLPLNGATVRLLKNGNEVATYTVDNNYNGLFAFFNLEPGEYTLDATCEGYKALGVSLDGPVEIGTVTVAANETSWPLLYLENNDYVPEAVVYENYPDPDQPAYLKLADEFNFNQTPTTLNLVGTVKDAVQIGDSTIVLTNEGINPHLYLVKTSTNEFVKELSTNGIYTENSPGFFSALNAINKTADNKLVGVSLTENQFGASDVTDGYTRGTARVYIWNDFDSDPTLFASTTNSGNFNNGNVGHAIVVNGASTQDCEIILTAMTAYGTSCNIRLVHILMANGVQSTVFYDKLHSSGFAGSQSAYGEELHMVVSPNDDAKVLLGGMGTITEFTYPTVSQGTPTDVQQLSSEFGATGVGFQCFKYAGHSLLVTPYAEEGVVKGIKILDITGGVENAKLIKTTNTDVTLAGAKAHHDPVLNGLTQYIATAYVDGADINATLTAENNYTQFTTKGAAQDVVKGIYAYGLSDEAGDSQYTFTFTANDDAQAAYLIFTDATTGETVGSVEVPNVQAGVNTVTLTYDQIPGNNNQPMNWAVNLVGKSIPTINVLNNPNDFAFNRIGNVVDNSPESDYFGRFYLVNRIGSSDANNGIWAYNADWSQINTTVIANDFTKGNPFRLATDEHGMLYMANWADGARSGVYKIDPATLNDVVPFFIGTHASDGSITTANGEVICTSTPSVFIAGTGADTHMYCHLEDYGNDISQYNIGNADGSIMETWDQAASRFWGVGAKLISTHAAVFHETADGGIWIVQNRSAGQNNTSVPSIMYVNNEGNIVFNSGSVDLPMHEHLTGTQYAAGAFNAEGNMMVVNQPDGTLKFFSVTYDEAGVPDVQYLYDYKAGVGNLVTQINFDYAGNLFVSGSKLAILSMPTEDNQATTPAKKEMIIVKSQANNGDVNNDGEVDVRDITALIDVIMNSVTDNPRADVNNDSEIDVRDITALIDIIMNN
ncbi:MAG: hypothetical protein II034_01260, partial [Muribaculaceae bacterium]|nr:hypothetical protein [Muribaculaceae bacterium]